MKRVVIVRAVLGICHMSVCAVKDASDEEILEVCNSQNPSGTSNGWGTVHKADDETWGKIGPVQCADDSERLHIVVGC